jgi:uncharacterized membrane protein YhaH (DUF805 family)
MKTKAILTSALLGVVLAILCYFALIAPATVAALAIRRKMPDAWFSGLIVWYATFVVIGVSTVAASIACRMTYKRMLRPMAK